MRHLYVNDDLDFDATLARVTDYLAETTPPGDLRQTRQWINSDADRKHLLDALDQAWLTIPPRRRLGIEASVAENVSRAIAEREPAQQPALQPALQPAQQRRWYMLPSVKVAASVFAATVLLAVVASIGNFSRNTSNPGSTSKSPLQTAEYRIYTTGAGQRATVDLGDGTKVTLNVASRLEVPRGYGSAHRSVRLTGEALFNVTHATSQPFLVSAAGTLTRVLGTVFGVRAYDANVQIAVKSGRVSVSPCEGGVASVESCTGASRSMVVEPANVLAVTPAGAMHAVSNVDIDNELAFSSGRYVLNGTPFRTVIDDLNRWYDVNIQLMDTSLGNEPLKGEVLLGNLEDLKCMLELTLKARIEQDGRDMKVFR